VACDVRGNAMCANKKHPREYLKTNIMADTMVLTDEGLRHLVAEMGISQVVYGTDNPLNWPVPVDMIVNHSTLTDAQKEQILSGNLMKLLKIPRDRDGMRKGRSQLPRPNRLGSWELEVGNCSASTSGGNLSEHSGTGPSRAG
jgi:hypothetical protein